jgi:small subunit ribosomal protein S2
MTETKEETQQETPASSLIEKYLKTGAHIGTRFKSGDMARYIYKQRKDGLNVLNVQLIDERIKQVGIFLAQYDPKKIAVVSRKQYGSTPAKEFANLVGAHAIVGRFVPGIFTNPESQNFFQPEVVLVTEPESDAQAIKEATRVRAVVVALASTNNSLKNIDIVIPVNNKGRKSLGLVFWLLAREFLKVKGDIAKDEDFTKAVEDFEHPQRESKEERKGRNQGRRTGSRGPGRSGRGRR